MIKTSRSRLEIRQEPGRKSSVVGALLIACGATGGLLSLAGLVAEWALPVGHGYAAAGAKLAASALVSGLGWLLLRRRSRVILDLDHRMVARYVGVGVPSVEGNRSWDLAEFSSVVIVRRERRRLLAGFSTRSEVVCLRRPDGTDLDLYWAGDAQDGAEIAQRVGRFAGLPCFGIRA
jgi:hypothetical protein